MRQNIIAPESSSLDRFLIAAVWLLTVIFLLGGAIGIPYAHHCRNAYMPSEIRYLIKVDDNIWPDWFYAAAYEEPQSRSIHFNGYWTFEPGATPLSGFVWTYHDNELTMEDISYSVIEFIREIA
jgi:hypothetical protein